jgi:hypothetical protein
MTTFSGKFGRMNAAGHSARKELIKREMRFVLHQDVRRFTRQLQARLLDEGCNLHPVLARVSFYEQFERRMAAELPVEHQSRFTRDQSQISAEFNHPRHIKAVQYAMSHLRDAEAKVAAAVLDVIDLLKSKWQQTAHRCTTGSFLENRDLENLITRLSELNPEGYLVRHGSRTIRRRLRIAMVTSLLRHMRHPEFARQKYGRLSQLIRKMSQNPALFPELMIMFQEQVPYSWLVIPQTFWRTLTSMDYESPK